MYSSGRFPPLRISDGAPDTRAGRNPDTLQFSPFVDPQNGDLSRDALKALQDTGVTRVVLFTQQIGSEMADGQAAAWIERMAPVVERAKTL